MTMPMNYEFDWKILGNKSVLHFFERCIITSKRPHAYIAYGHPEVGKRYSMERFVRALMCYDFHSNNHSFNKEGSVIIPCGSCIHCKQINHPDIVNLELSIDLKTQFLKKNIGIENVKEFQHRLHSGSFLNNGVYGMIYDAHALSLSASNALLKLIEEPPRGSSILLVADSIDLLPKTLLSRCQRVCFSFVPHDEMIVGLQQLGVSVERSRCIAYLSRGSVSKALRLVDRESYDEYLAFIYLWLQIFSSPIYERFKAIESQFKIFKGSVAQCAHMKKLLDVALYLMREILLVRLKKQDRCGILAVVPDFMDRIGSYTIESSERVIDRIHRAGIELDNDGNPQLIMEHLIIYIS